MSGKICRFAPEVLALGLQTLGTCQSEDRTVVVVSRQHSSKESVRDTFHSFQVLDTYSFLNHASRFGRVVNN